MVQQYSIELRSDIVKLSKPVVDYINTHQEYIDDDNFTFLYNDLFFLTLANKWESEYTGEFTNALVDAEINPLDNMSIIPGYYMCGDSQTTGMFVPKHVIRVENAAFQDSSIEEIDFGVNVERIEDFVLSGCQYLWRVVIHNKVQHIGSEVFFGCDELKEITFRGTRNEWLRMHKEAGWRRGAVNLHTVICDDGEIEY